jgi:hypothetical protein
VGRNLWIGEIGRLYNRKKSKGYGGRPESFVIVPMEDEVSILREEIKKRIEYWDRYSEYFHGIFWAQTLTRTRE